MIVVPLLMTNAFGDSFGRRIHHESCQYLFDVPPLSIERVLNLALNPDSLLVLPNPQARVAIEILRDLAITHPKSGLLNDRTYITQVFRNFLETSMGKVGDNNTFVVIHLDLSSFGVVDKFLGQQKGDELIRLFSTTLKSQFRTSDLIVQQESGEWLLAKGGDEFEMWLSFENGPDAVYQILKKRFHDILYELLNPKSLYFQSVQETIAKVEAECSGWKSWLPSCKDYLNKIKLLKAGLYFIGGAYFINSISPFHESDFQDSRIFLQLSDHADKNLMATLKRHIKKGLSRTRAFVKEPKPTFPTIFKIESTNPLTTMPFKKPKPINEVIKSN